METKNYYSLPIEKKHIRKIILDAPAHKKYYSEKEKAWFDLTRAIDFLCDIGTPVKAALDGKVVAVQDGITKNWNKPVPPPENFMSEEEQDGNYVILKHKYDEFSIYSHLQPNRIKVKVGDKVSRGEILGYVGNTGWSIKPHLHFMVFRFIKPNKKDFVSLKIRWKDKI